MIKIANGIKVAALLGEGGVHPSHPQYAQFKREKELKQKNLINTPQYAIPLPMDIQQALYAKAQKLKDANEIQQALVGGVNEFIGTPAGKTWVDAEADAFNKLNT